MPGVEYDQRVAEVLGFDPSTGKPLRVTAQQPPQLKRAGSMLEEILGFDKDGKRVLPRNFGVKDDPRFIDFFEQKATDSEFISSHKRTRTNPLLLFSAVDDGFKNVSRRYHYMNPQLSLESQLFTVNAFIILERRGQWGQNPPADGYRILRIGLKDIEKGTAQTVEFSDGDVVEIDLSGGDWGKTNIAYESGKLKSGKFSMEQTFCKRNFQDVTTPVCELPAGDNSILIPNYLTSPHPTDLFVKNPSFEDAPFEIDSDADHEWKSKDIAEAFRLRMVPRTDYGNMLLP